MEGVRKMEEGEKRKGRLRVDQEEKVKLRRKRRGGGGERVSER